MRDLTADIHSLDVPVEVPEALYGFTNGEGFIRYPYDLVLQGIADGMVRGLSFRSRGLEVALLGAGDAITSRQIVAIEDEMWEELRFAHTKLPDRPVHAGDVGVEEAKLRSRKRLIPVLAHLGLDGGLASFVNSPIRHGLTGERRTPAVFSGTHSITGHDAG
jgi:hypothetical protein